MRVVQTMLFFWGACCFDPVLLQSTTNTLYPAGSGSRQSSVGIASGTKPHLALSPCVRIPQSSSAVSSCIQINTLVFLLAGCTRTSFPPHHPIMLSAPPNSGAVTRLVTVKLDMGMSFDNALDLYERTVMDQQTIYGGRDTPTTGFYYRHSNYVGCERLIMLLIEVPGMRNGVDAEHRAYKPYNQFAGFEKVCVLGDSAIKHVVQM